MTDRLREAAQAALDAWGDCGVGVHPMLGTALRNLRAALAETKVEQEPVAWIESPGMIRMNPLHKMALPSPLLDWKIPLYTAPQRRREWQGLTDEEVERLTEKTFWPDEFARAIEAALKDRNT